jgi:hypothetical protein
MPIGVLETALQLFFFSLLFFSLHNQFLTVEFEIKSFCCGFERAVRQTGVFARQIMVIIASLLLRELSIYLS